MPVSTLDPDTGTFEKFNNIRPGKRVPTRNSSADMYVDTDNSDEPPTVEQINSRHSLTKEQPSCRSGSSSSQFNNKERL